MAEQEPMEVVPIEREQAVAPVSPEFGVFTLEEARERLKLMAGLKKLAISYTTADEWKRFGDKPYLEATGAMKFAQVFNISFSGAVIQPFAYTDDRGPVTEFYASVTAHFGDRTCQGEGVSSTADEFFNGREVDPNDPEKKRTRRLPMSEIDRPSVRKKAYTQACADATRKILGLSFTWDEVNAALGQRAETVGSVQFGGKSEFKKAEQSAGKGAMSPDKQELLSIVMEAGHHSQEKAQNILYELTHFKGKDGSEQGSRSVLSMSDAWVGRVLPKARKMIEAWRVAQQQQQAQEVEDGPQEG